MMPPTEPPDAESAAPEVPAAAPPPVPALRPVHLLALAVAVAGGALVTLMLMSAKPAAHDASSAVTPASAPAARSRNAAPVIDPSSPPKWSSRGQARWVNPSRRHAAFEVPAERPVAVWNGTVTPVLVVRCADRRVDAFVYTNSAARIEAEDDNHTVKLAFDDEAAVHERWPDSVEHDALFAPDGRALATRLSAARSLRFTFAPHNAGPATAVFDVRGLQERLAQTKACPK
jgi:hypothetical protein